MYSVAASIIIFVVVGLWLFSSKHESNEQYFQAYYKPFPATIVTRGKSDANRAQFSYSSGNYKNAAEDLENAITAEADPYAKQDLMLLLGNSYLMINEVSGAEKCFRELVTTGREDVRQHAMWYLALTLLKRNQTEDALRWLEKVQQINSVYRPQAGELSNKLLNRK
jgi:tetratricopeptide (TPR) repeat protein